MMKILAICGSLQAQSKNLTLLRTAARLAPAAVELVLFDGLRHLPHFNPDIESEAPDSVRRWRQALSDSDAVLIASPEYGFSLPGALKNAIDWVIGSGEPIPIGSAFEDQVAGLVRTLVHAAPAACSHPRSI